MTIMREYMQRETGKGAEHWKWEIQEGVEKLCELVVKHLRDPKETQPVTLIITSSN